MTHLRRYLQLRYHQTLHEAFENNAELQGRHASHRAEELINACKKAYLFTKRAQQCHFRKKFEAIARAFPVNLRDEVSYDVTGNKVTDLTDSLCQEELNLLSKGPKFAIQEKITDYTRTDIQVQLCSLGYQLCWREERGRKQWAQPIFPKYPESQYVSVPPEADPDVEMRIRRCQIEISQALDSARRTHGNNLTGEEMTVIKNLKKKYLSFSYQVTKEANFVLYKPSNTLT